VSTREWLLNAYAKAREQHPIHLFYDPNKLNIAVHLRRGDLLLGQQFSDLSSRMLPDAQYLEILNMILRNTQQQIAIYIFSEGRDGIYHSESGQAVSWKAYFQNTPHEVHECIDSDVMSSFYYLLNADILIGSKSGMSHLAGLLNQQMKIMPKMWYAYRGANRLLEVSGLPSELSQDQIKSHLQGDAVVTELQRVIQRLMKKRSKRVNGVHHLLRLN